MSVIHNHQVLVLVVDPDLESRTTLVDAVRGDGYACQAVGTFDEAVARAKEKKPDLLISDVNLDNASGIELFDVIKGLNPDCPALFVSNSRRPETLQTARLAGATYFLSKPLDPTVLMELVDKALWMPHLVRRHIDSAAHGLKAPSFAPHLSTHPR